jgi:hypothetical protein
VIYAQCSESKFSVNMFWRSSLSTWKRTVEVWLYYVPICHHHNWGIYDVVGWGFLFFSAVLSAIMSAVPTLQSSLICGCQYFDSALKEGDVPWFVTYGLREEWLSIAFNFITCQQMAALMCFKLGYFL